MLEKLRKYQEYMLLLPVALMLAACMGPVETPTVTASEAPPSSTPSATPEPSPTSTPTVTPKPTIQIIKILSLEDALSTDFVEFADSLASVTPTPFPESDTWYNASKVSQFSLINFTAKINTEGDRYLAGATSSVIGYYPDARLLMLLTAYHLLDFNPASEIETVNLTQPHRHDSLAVFDSDTDSFFFAGDPAADYVIIAVKYSDPFLLENFSLIPLKVSPGYDFDRAARDDEEFLCRGFAGEVLRRGLSDHTSILTLPEDEGQAVQVLGYNLFYPGIGKTPLDKIGPGDSGSPAINKEIEAVGLCNIGGLDFIGVTPISVRYQEIYDQVLAAALNN